MVAQGAQVKMAMFGEPKKKSGFDWTGALVNAFSSEAGQMYQKKKAGRAEQERQQAVLGQLRQALATEGHPEHVINALMADPKRISELIFEKYKTREGGPGGISVGAIGPDGKLNTQHSSGWQDGNFYGSSDGTSAPNVIHEGVKTVPVVPGGAVYGIGGATGRIINGAGAPSETAPDVLTDEDIIRMKGGAGPQGPRPFPTGVFGRGY